MNDFLVKELENFITEIDEEYPLEFAYLFGSVAKETSNNESDIDMALMFKEKYSSLDEAMIRGKAIDKGEVRLSAKLDIISLNSAPLLLKYEIIRSGIILKDSIERGSFESLVFREYFDFSYYANIYNDACLSSIKEGSFFVKKVK